MNSNYLILTLIILTTILAIIIFIRKYQIREAFISFLIAQLLSWPFSIIEATLGFIDSPVRFFSNATDSNFLLSYIMYPSLFAIFQVRFPQKKDMLIKFIYFFAFVLGLSLLDILIATYTDLLEYKSWKWYWNFPYFFVSFFFARRYVRWFLNKLSYSNLKEWISLEKIILFLSTIFSIAVLIFSARKKPLQSHFIFLFAGMPVWILGLCVVEWGLIEYPYREFSTVNRTSFIFEYLVLPVICVVFNVFYPIRSSPVSRLGFYSIFCSLLTAFEYILEKYTMVIRYIKWDWYWTWISVFLILWLSRKINLWFFKVVK